MNAAGSRSRNVHRFTSLVMDEDKVTDVAVPPGNRP
jgi:hypothetical protein